MVQRPHDITVTPIRQPVLDQRLSFTRWLARSSRLEYCQAVPKTKASVPLYSTESNCLNHNTGVLQHNMQFTFDVVIVNIHS